MIKVEDMLPDYTSSIKNYSQICFICALLGVMSGFIHFVVSVAFSVFGNYLIILRKYRYDMCKGINPYSISFKEIKFKDEYNKQEEQLAFIGIILIITSVISGGAAPFMWRAIERAIIAPLFG